MLERTTGSGGTARNIAEVIRAFRDLQPGWNSYRAPRISDLAIKSALEVVHVLSRRQAPQPCGSSSPSPTGWQRRALPLRSAANTRHQPRRKPAAECRCSAFCHYQL